MFVALTFRGKPVGVPMDGLSGEKLLQFIADQLELGRAVHIAPKLKDLFWAGTQGTRYTVAWDDRTGQRHEREFSSLEDAWQEARALERSSLCEWVELAPGP